MLLSLSSNYRFLVEVKEDGGRISEVPEPGFVWVQESIFFILLFVSGDDVDIELSELDLILKLLPLLTLLFPGQILPLRD